MVFGHWRIACANYSSVSSVSSFCISPASFMSSAQRKSGELEVENAMASGGIKASDTGPPTASTSARRIDSVRLEHSPQLCPNLNVQAALPIAHRRAAASEKVGETLSGKTRGLKCWQVVGMDMRLFQFVVGSHRQRPNYE